MKVINSRLADYGRVPVIRSATVKDFSGGLDLSDDDLNINSQFSKVQTNMYRSRDGRLRLRYGVRPYAEMPSSTGGNIIALEYYAGCMIAGTTNGEIVAFPVNGAGVITLLWPTGASGKVWSVGLKQINFAQSRGELIIVNGVDKPLRLKSDFSIDFLTDAATGSNINTPIAPFVVSCQDFIVMAGQPNNPSKLYFTSRGTTGTFSGDPAPNDATTFDVGGNVAHGDNLIVGLSVMNGYLFAAFETSTVVLAVGEYEGTAHVPRVFDVFDTYGSISHKSMVVVDKELWYCDQSGVLKIARNQLSTGFIPDRVSQGIDPQLLKDLQFARTLGNINTCFAVHHRLAAQYLLFIPSGSGSDKYTWVSTRYNPTEAPSWSLFLGMNFVAAGVSSIGKLYLATNRRLFFYGDLNNEFFDDNGIAISFDWEMPWSIFSQYDKIKKLKAVRVYSRGTAPFSLQLFVDGIYKDRDNNYNPTAQINFVAGDSKGFGAQSGDQPYGGGRRAADPRIWKLDGKFIQGKLRISGKSTEDMQIVGLSLTYTIGGRKR